MGVFAKTLFVHGGLTLDMIRKAGINEFSVEKINEFARENIRKVKNSEDEKNLPRNALDFLTKSSDSPFWIRDFVKESSAQLEDQLDDVLSEFGAVRMVSGHNIKGPEIHTFFDSKYWDLDTCMSKDGIPNCWDGSSAEKRGGLNFMKISNDEAVAINID